MSDHDPTKATITSTAVLKSSVIARRGGPGKQCGSEFNTAVRMSAATPALAREGRGGLFARALGLVKSPRRSRVGHGCRRWCPTLTDLESGRAGGAVGPLAWLHGGVRVDEALHLTVAG
jgi:hypothetical protein